MIKSKSMFKEHIEVIEKCNDIESLRDILKIVREEIKNNRSFSFFITKNIIVSEKIKEIYLYNDSIKESVYRLINDIDSNIVCKCGNKVSFFDNNRGYSKFCADRKCKFMNEERNKNTKETFQVKYGSHPMKNEEVKQKMKNSTFEIYGFDNIMKYKSKNGMVNSPFGQKSVQEKIKKTFNEKYGGHPMQCDDVFEKNLKSRVSFMDYETVSGKIIKLQGYENYGFEFLLNKYDENDIVTEVKDINKEVGFIYYNHDNKKRKYYPDFYVKNINKIYEIKSIWTYKANIEKNLAKKKACEDRGMKFEFLIFDNKGNRILV